MEKVYSPEEVAEILKINIKTIQKWLREGRIKGKKLGKEWRVSESALQAFWDSAPEHGDERKKKQD